MISLGFVDGSCKQFSLCMTSYIFQEALSSNALVHIVGVLRFRHFLWKKNREIHFFAAGLTFFHNNTIFI